MSSRPVLPVGRSTSAMSASCSSRVGSGASPRRSLSGLIGASLGSARSTPRPEADVANVHDPAWPDSWTQTRPSQVPRHGGLRCWSLGTPANAHPFLARRGEPTVES